MKYNCTNCASRFFIAGCVIAEKDDTVAEKHSCSCHKKQGYFYLTQYGFVYSGVRIEGVRIERQIFDDKTKAVVLAIRTKKRDLQVTVTKTGKLQIWDGMKELK